jgi:hypothetical protein
MQTLRQWITLCEAERFTLPPDIAEHVSFLGTYDPTERIAHIHSIISAEKGYGSKAVAAFEQWARQQGAWKITGGALRTALPFWWKLGYSDRDRGSDHVPIHKVL